MIGRHSVKLVSVPVASLKSLVDVGEVSNLNCKHKIGFRNIWIAVIDFSQHVRKLCVLRNISIYNEISLFGQGYWLWWIRLSHMNNYAKLLYSK